MQYSEVQIGSVPSIIFAHKYATGPNTWEIVKFDHLCEITYVESGDFKQIMPDGSEIEYTAPCILVSFHEEEIKMVTTQDQHIHYTVAFSVAGYIHKLTESEVKAKTFSQWNSRNNFSAIVPNFINDITVSERIGKLIKAFLQAYSGITLEDNLKCAKYIFDVLATLSKYSYEAAQTVARDTSGEFLHPYTTKAIAYINNHIGEKIYVSTISSELNISYRHLSRVFAQDMGMSIVHYINKVKVDRVVELLMSKNSSLRDVALQVGVNDEKYLCRIFKKQMGMSFTKYKKQTPFPQF